MPYTPVWGSKEHFLQEQHHYLADFITNTFGEIFKKEIDDVEYNPDEVSIYYHYENDEPNDDEENPHNYEITIFGNHYDFVCDKRQNLKKILKCRAYGNAELFNYNPVYIIGFCNKDTGGVMERNFYEPDPELDDVPFYDVPECPCCMEKWGERYGTPKIIGNPLKKHIIKRKIYHTIKRNTFCGHPLCMDCFKKICDDTDEPSCPMCRKKYQDTGDIEMEEEYPNLTDDMIRDMIRTYDDALLDIVDIDALITQAIIADGIPHLLQLRCFVDDDEHNFIAGIQEHPF
jgi:hypothetical protein